jgi:hypothetical protein
MANNLIYRLALISNNNHLFRDLVPVAVTDHTGAAPDLADRTLSSTKRIIILFIEAETSARIFFLPRFLISSGRDAGDRNRIIFRNISCDGGLIWFILHQPPFYTLQ